MGGDHSGVGGKGREIDELATSGGRYSKRLYATSTEGFKQTWAEKVK